MAKRGKKNVPMAARASSKPSAAKPNPFELARCKKKFNVIGRRAGVEKNVNAARSDAVQRVRP